MAAAKKAVANYGYQSKTVVKQIVKDLFKDTTQTSTAPPPAKPEPTKPKPKRVINHNVTKI